MNFKKIKKAIIILPVISLLFLGLGCKGGSEEVRRALSPVTLDWWRVFDEDDDFATIIAGYQALHPHITINYRRLRLAEYEDALLNALAEDRGPDIVSLHNTWIGKYQSKLAPMPPTTTLPYQFVTGTIQKQVQTELRTTPTLNLRDLQTNFLDVVREDVTRPDSTNPNNRLIYGLPVSVDTMVLFFNRDLLNNAGIPQPPTTWDQFQDQIKRLTKQDASGNITQAGAALGTAVNVPRYFDILSLLMMQNGTEMTDDSGRATFERIPAGATGVSSPPGVEALAFYTGFANPSQEIYTWNNNLPDALELFTTGRLAFFLGYSYHLAQIRATTPKLKVEMTNFPQIEGSPESYFANYWVESVPAKSDHQNEAWDFILYLTNQQNVTSYLERVKKPTALRALIPAQLEDLDLYFFARQLLSTRSWYRGVNPGAAETTFAELINTVVRGEVLPEEAVPLAARVINQTLR